MTKPHVVICGGGPSGLLASVLLNKIGVTSTVLEKAVEADEWSSKSHTIVLGERGCGALEKAGLLDVAKVAGNERRFIYFYDGKAGTIKAMPKKIPGIGFTRPSLVSCLENEAKQCANINIQRGAGVSSVQEGDELKVVLQDGTCVSGTHVLGADGKWSKVRESIPSLSSQAQMQTVPSFGVHMNAKNIQGFKTDGTYVISPSKECMFYIIVSPRESEDEGFSISMVCYDETVERYPWLEPPSNTKSGGWEDEYSAMPQGMESEKSLADHLDAMFQEELPSFYQALDKDAFQSARVNRRVTWIKMTSKDGENVTFATQDGSVALIGDAIHAMTPSMGEGCNCALESAARLVESVQAVMKRKDESACSVDSLSEGFVTYGASRPKEVIPIQEQSAARNYLKKEGSGVKNNSTGKAAPNQHSVLAAITVNGALRGHGQVAQ